jgi:uncharacterized protein with ATP-grasp and redox domains
VRLAVREAQLTSSDPQVQERIVRTALIEAAHVDFRAPPVVAGRRVQRLVRRLAGDHDPYRKLKRQSTALALRLAAELRRLVLESPVPLGAALSVAIAANTLDFGVYEDIDESAVRDSLTRAAAESLDGAVDFVREAAAARRILYIADNAGEIVFDGLVIELLEPGKVTLAVRGAPIVNDATLRDASAARLTDTVLVIDSGSDVAGVLLDECSDEFRSHYESADLIIAKGQGNYETLDQQDARIWFALKIKCPVVARAVGGVVGQRVLFRHVARGAESRPAQSHAVSVGLRRC